jgi:hypothetical protein
LGSQPAGPHKKISRPNGCYHCAGDDRTDARNGRQLPAAFGAVRQLFDLFSDPLADQARPHPVQCLQI